MILGDSGELSCIRAFIFAYLLSIAGVPSVGYGKEYEMEASDEFEQFNSI